MNTLTLAADLPATSSLISAEIDLFSDPDLFGWAYMYFGL